MCQPATGTSHLSSTPLKDHPHLPSSSGWCVSRLAALPCDRLQPRGEWSTSCQTARPSLSLSLSPQGPARSPGGEQTKSS